jgi:hypothetical protein
MYRHSTVLSGRKRAGGAARSELDWTACGQAMREPTKAGAREGVGKRFWSRAAYESGSGLSAGSGAVRRR